MIVHMHYVVYPTPDIVLYTLMIRACASPVTCDNAILFQTRKGSRSMDGNDSGSEDYTNRWFLQYGDPGVCSVRHEDVCE